MASQKACIHVPLCLVPACVKHTVDRVYTYANAERLGPATPLPLS